jgi:ankyrin repeat protein
MLWSFMYSAWEARVLRPRLTAALIEATNKGDAEASLRWLNRGADPNARLRSDETVLQRATQKGDVRLVRLLLDHGANVDARGIDVSEFGHHRWEKSGRTALMIAARRGDLRIVRCLLDRGADPKLRDDLGVTALFHAVWGGHTAVAVGLLEHREGVKARDRYGRLRAPSRSAFAPRPRRRR